MDKASEFSSSGYFSGEVTSKAQKFRDRHVHYFALYRRIATLGYKTIGELQNDSRDVRRGILTCLAIRVLSSYDAVRLCIERGMEFETRVLLRSQLEAMYTIAACEKDDKFHVIFLKASTRDRHRILDRLQQNQHKVTVYDKVELKKSVNDLEAKMKAVNIPRLQTREIAKKAGMELSYELVYSFYSLSVHVNPVSLQENVVWDEKVGIREILWGPRHERACSYMLSAMNTMIVSLLAVSRIFQLNVESELSEIFRQWEKLSKKYAKENPKK
jgi:hypothetical protein